MGIRRNLSLRRNEVFCRGTRIVSVASVAFCVFLFPAVAKSETINVGVLSFDEFIPGSNDSPGVNAFNFSNFTGAFAFPLDFPVIDDLTFQGAVLTLFPDSLPSQVLSLPNIGPGFLLDPGGNPFAQVSESLAFTSARFTATVIPATFTLSDGRVFSVSSSTIDVLLLPSSGIHLTPGADQALITVSGSASTSVPEPSSWSTLAVGLVYLARNLRKKCVHSRVV